MRLVSWNVARRLGKLEQQAVAVAALEADLVALQEITASSEPLWRTALADAGFDWVETSLTYADPRRSPPGPRRHGVLAAAREPLEVIDPGWMIPWPESVLTVLVGGSLRLHVAHVPNAANGWIKPDTLRGIYLGMLADEAAGRGPRIVCGDLNIPRRETASGVVVTFAQDSRAKLRPERGERWDSAERDILTRLAPAGMVDAFRHLHGYGRKEVSWRYPSGRGGYRLDHVLVSEELDPIGFEYVHAVREAGLSDHAAALVELRHS